MMNKEVFMIDQVKPKQKIFGVKRDEIRTMGFELCVAVFLVIAITIVF